MKVSLSIATKSYCFLKCDECHSRLSTAEGLSTTDQHDHNLHDVRRVCDATTCAQVSHKFWVFTAQLMPEMPEMPEMKKSEWVN
jgi:hypothetical protein